MSESHDPLDRLRKAWRAEQQALPPEAIEHCDARTREAWKVLRNQWQAEHHAAPREHGPAIERALLRSGVLAPRPLRRIRPALAIAAGFLLACFFWHPWAEQPAEQTFDEAAASPSQDPSPPGQTTHRVAETQKEPSDPPATDVSRWQLREDGFETRAGSVTLLLIQPTPPSDPNPGDNL